MTNQNILSAEQEKFNEEHPCKVIGCDSHGSIAEQVGEDEWEQQQCQWCDEVRLPFLAFLLASNARIRLQTLQEFQGMIEGEKKSEYYIDRVDGHDMSRVSQTNVIFNSALSAIATKLSALTHSPKAGE